MLVNARFMGEGVNANNLFFCLHLYAGEVGHQFARAEELFGVNTRVRGKMIGAGSQRHDNLFQRGIPGAFAQTIQDAINLTNACPNSGLRIGHCQPEIIMAVDLADDVGRRCRSVNDCFAEIPELVGHRIADGVGYVKRSSSAFDCKFKNFDEEINVLSACVFSGKFNIFHQDSSQ